ncbi:hypothetical protein ACKWTF_001215 [Chironomus riparius]
MKFFISLLVIFVTLNHVSSQFSGGHSLVEDINERARLLKIVKNNLCSFEGCWELHKVEKITTQVVAGSLSTVHGIFEEVMEEEFYRGAVKIWEQPWMNFTEVTFDKEEVIEDL